MKIEEKVVHQVKKVTLPKDAAGRRMTKKIPIVTSDQTISDIKKLISSEAKNLDSISYIYVTSKAGVLKGVVSIKNVYTNSPTEKVAKIMTDKIIKVHPHTDQERAARLAVKNSLKAIPVVDEHDHLLGTLTSDTILSILDQEAEEDLMKVSGIVLGKGHSDESSRIPVEKTFINRIPWIIVGLFGGLAAAKIISGFESVLEENIILAGFIPLVVYLANAVGNQAQIIFIRDLSQDAKLSFLKYSIKQILITLLIAASVWLVFLGLAYVIWGDLIVGFVVGLSIFISIILATIFALLIPYLLTKMKADPAIGSGPFTTIIQDILSIVVYFVVASALL